MIITGKDMRHIVNMARRETSINAYKLDDMDMFFSTRSRHLVEPFKAYELGISLGFVNTDERPTVPTRVVTYSLWGYDTENGAFVFKKDTK